MRDELYKTLNECVALLNGELMIGQQCVYATMDRTRHNDLLKRIAECKRALMKAHTEDVYG